MTYNAKTDELLPWSLVSELPTSLPTPPTADGTFTSEMIDTLAPFVAEQGPGKLYLQWASYLAQFPSNDHDAPKLNRVVGSIVRLAVHPPRCPRR